MREPGLPREIYVLAFASFAVGTQAYVFSGQLEGLARDLGVTVAKAGQLASAFALTFAIAAPVVATVTGRLDRKPVIVIGLAAIGLLNVASALAPGFEWLLGLRVACGLAATAIVPIASAAAAQLAPPERRGRALSVVLAGTTLAFALGVPMGSGIGGLLGWRATFAYAGALGLGAALAIALALPSVRPPGSVRPAFSSALNADVLRWIALTLAAFAAAFTVVAYIGPVVTLATGVSGGAVGWFQTLVGVGSIAGVAIGGRLADKPGRMRSAALVFAVMTLTLSTYSLLVGRGPEAPGNAALLCLVLAFGAGSVFSLAAIVQAGLVEAAPQAGAVALALNGSAIFFGQGLGALLGGGVIASVGYGALGLVAGAIAGATAIGAALASRPRLIRVGDVKA